MKHLRRQTFWRSTLVAGGLALVAGWLGTAWGQTRPGAAATQPDADAQIYADTKHLPLDQVLKMQAAAAGISAQELQQFMDEGQVGKK